MKSNGPTHNTPLSNRTKVPPIVPQRLLPVTPKRPLKFPECVSSLLLRFARSSPLSAKCLGPIGRLTSRAPSCLEGIMGAGGTLNFAIATATYRDQLKKEMKLIGEPPSRFRPVNALTPRPMTSIEEVVAQRRQNLSSRATATLLSPRQPALDSLSPRRASDSTPYSTPLVAQGGLGWSLVGQATPGKSLGYVAPPLLFLRLPIVASGTNCAMPLVPYELATMNRVYGLRSY